MSNMLKWPQLSALLTTPLIFQPQPLARAGVKFARAFSYAIAIGLLIFADQLTKAAALATMPSIHRFARRSLDLFGFGLHLHAPDEWTTLVAVGALTFCVITWLFPLPRIVRILWTAAALSNHVEMLARPGTIDFLALRGSLNIYVFNIADCYIALGYVVLFCWAAKVFRAAQTSDHAVPLTA